MSALGHFFAIASFVMPGTYALAGLIWTQFAYITNKADDAFGRGILLVLIASVLSWFMSVQFG